MPEAYLSLKEIGKLEGFYLQNWIKSQFNKEVLSFKHLLMKMNDKLEENHKYLQNSQNKFDHYTISKSISIKNSRINLKILVKGKNNLTSGYLDHVIETFKYSGHQIIHDPADGWHILWHHDYPFIDTDLGLMSINHNHKINHFPGSGFITSKASLMRYDEAEGLENRPRYLPLAFTLPNQLSLFVDHLKVHHNSYHNVSFPDSKYYWVLKSKDHRGIEIMEPDLIMAKYRNKATSSNEEVAFVQTYIRDPLLIDGRKFDIGMYVLITSLSPLRVYVYWGDVLFRFCPRDYHPFDPSDKDKYVIGDDYTPLWQIPSLSGDYLNHSSTFKTAFDNYCRAHLRIKNVDSKIWARARTVIVDVLKRNRAKMLSANQGWNQKGAYFELVRFDFALDSNLELHLMEVNMSPNLSSDHFPPNKRLYLRLLHDTIRLVLSNFYNEVERDASSSEIDISVRDLSVFPDLCARYCQNVTRPNIACHHLCTVNGDKVAKGGFIESSYLEHLNKGSFKKVLPLPPLENSDEPIFGLSFWEGALFNRSMVESFFEKGFTTDGELGHNLSHFETNTGIDTAIINDVVLRIWYYGKGLQSDDKSWGE
ncbi:unnamed protein product [Gordionus sp. m RMFG-2023]